MISVTKVFDNDLLHHELENKKLLNNKLPIKKLNTIKRIPIKIIKRIPKKGVQL